MHYYNIVNQQELVHMLLSLLVS